MPGTNLRKNLQGRVRLINCDGLKMPGYGRASGQWQFAAKAVQPTLPPAIDQTWCYSLEFFCQVTWCRNGTSHLNSFSLHGILTALPAFPQKRFDRTVNRITVFDFRQDE